MGDTIIQVENLSKRYVLGRAKERYTALRDVLTNQAKTWMQAINPWYRSRSRFRHSPETEFWALQDVSFEVKQGDRIGIIGHNGAGKSTLLKILSRITEPTTGCIRIQGRVASLLEVGTGFHPELTGRENIYLNGAILGMSKREIRHKFDEIVAFAEVEKFLDTPVKRYSSGMYVRLAFAVAAHLEPEILIVDEVLAVGDAAFQRKCLGKMEDVAEQGRTVLFVSHNLGMLRSLCSQCLLLEKGRLIACGETHDILNQYLANQIHSQQGEVVWDSENAPGDRHSIWLQRLALTNETGTIQDTFDAGQPIQIVMEYGVAQMLRGMRLVLQFVTSEGIVAFASTDHALRETSTQPGVYRTICTIPGKLLNRNHYTVRVSAGIPGVRVLIPGQEIMSFSVVGSGHHGSYFPEVWPGVVAPQLDWMTQPLSSSVGVGGRSPL
jgi:lipopolysaccharide transport system ATP-binding protein